MVKVKEDLTGKKFGRLTVIEQTDDYINPNGSHYARWLCLCDCGNSNSVKVRGTSLKNGSVKSCGCLQRENTSKANEKENVWDLESEDYGIGYTRKGELFWFDKEDFDLIRKYCWRYSHGYVVAYDKENRCTISLHNLVMGDIPDGCEVDHKKHPSRWENKIDNRKCNLQIKTRSQNMMNQTLSTKNTSGTTGVSWREDQQRWRAYIQLDGKHIHLGNFINKEDAIAARKAAEIKYFGEYRYEANN